MSSSIALDLHGNIFLTLSLKNLVARLITFSIAVQGMGIVMSVTGALILVHAENLDIHKCVQSPFAPSNSDLNRDLHPIFL